MKVEELSMAEFSEWPVSCWKSPPLSPLHQECALPSSPWEFEEVEFVLKEDNYGDI